MFRKLMSVLLIIALLVCNTGTMVFAEAVADYSAQKSTEASALSEEKIVDSGQCGDNLTWTLYEGGTLEISGSGAMYDYEYVSSDLPTTAPWYEHKDKINSLVLHEGITSIGEKAFCKCDSITGELVIPESVKTIGRYAFQSCSGFTGELIIPESVTKIGPGAFSYCSGFTGQLVIPKGITIIEFGTFNECSGLTGGLVLPKGVTEIGDYAFYSCNNLTGDLVVPEEVVEIAEYAFANCYGLKGSLVLPNGLKTIGQYAFYNCSFTGEVTIPKSVTSIGVRAFRSFENIIGETIVTMLCSGADIAEDAFSWVYNCLFRIPEYAEDLIQYAIDNELNYEIIVSNIIDSGKCGDNLTWTLYKNGTLEISGTGAMYDYEYGNSSLPTTAPWYEYEDKINSLVLGEGITSIGNRAFYKCDSITGELVIPKGVTRIGDIAFRECSGFTGNLVIPKGVTYIGVSAFYECIGFTGDLVIPDTVTTIGSGAFASGIGSGFDGKLVLSKNITTIEEGTFVGLVNITGDLIIPEGVKVIGPHAFLMCGFDGNLVIPNSVKIIDKSAFASCGGFKGELIVPVSVTNIGRDAFMGFGHYEDKVIATLLCSGATIDPYAFTNSDISLYRIPKDDEDLIQYAIDNELSYEIIESYIVDSGKCGDNLTWTLYKDGMLRISGTGDMYGYGSEGGPWKEFYNNKLKKLVLEEGITSIGAFAFYDCNCLTGELVIPESVERIEACSFEECTGFTGDLVISDNVKEVGVNAFRGCTGFAGNLVLSKKIEKIKSSAFYGCSGFIGDLVIPNSVRVIEDHAFFGCSGLTGDLIIPEGVIELGSYAFKGCSGFDGRLVIPKSVTQIKTFTFYGCSGFTGDLIIPETMTELEWGAFEGCSGFDGRLVISEGIREIKESAFRECSSLTGELVIPNSVTYIGPYAFGGCSGFTGDLVIPEGIRTIENGAFQGCSGFTGNLVIPNSVTTIGSYAFSGCSGFTGNLVIPNSVTSIGRAAFQSCDGFTGNLVMSDNLTIIEDYTFNNCSGFTGNLVIPNSVITIGEWAFSHCSGFTGDLAIPSSVKTIGQQAFYGCSGFNGRLVLPEGVTTIEQQAFSDCSGFTGDLVIPSSVKIIGQFAFCNCSGFNGRLVLPEGMTTIEQQAFRDCSGFTGDLVIPSSVKIIGQLAFYNCSGFNGRLVLSEGMTTIEQQAFSGCSGFTGDLVIPNSVTTIENHAFYGCNGFDGNLVLSNSLTTIGILVFADCYGLNGDVIIPESVTTIGDAAFYSTKLTLVVPFASENATYLANYARYVGQKYRILEVETAGYEGVYDGNSHSITLTVPKGAVVEYATSEYGQYSEVKPMFVNVCEETVYYKIKKGSDVLFEGYETVEIIPAGLVGVVATSNEAIYDGMPHGITVTAPEGAVATYSTSLYGPYSEEMPTLTDVGTRTIFYKVQKDNYIEVVGSETITITPRTIEDLEAKLEYDSIVYDGNYKYPMVTVEGLADYDYEVIYDNNINAGTAIVTITGLRNCTGIITKTFVIDKATMSVTSYGYTGIYDGNGHSIDVYAPSGARVTYSTSENGNFTSTKPTLTNVGTKTIYYKVERDNYVTVTGSEVVTITPADLVKVTIEGYKGIYDGNAHGLTVTALSNAKVTYSTSLDGEYTEEAPTLTNVGTMTVYYKIEKDNYVAAIGSETIVIEPRTIADMEATLEYESVVYDAVAKTPAVTVVGLSESDYEVSYENNTNVGRATVTITGVGNYNGKITKVFDITPAGIAGITASDYEGAFDGKAHSITVNAPEGAVVKYSTSLNGVYSTQAPTLTNVGTMTVFYRVERANFVTVVDTAIVTITAKSIEDMGAELEYDSVTYDGTAKFPTVTVEGLASSDYEVSYEGNTNAGTATVTITGKGNFEGTITKTFEITKATLDGLTTELAYDSVTYDGTAKKPKVTVDGLTVSDYEVTYEDNTNAGTATVTITGKGNYKGTITKTFEITKAMINVTSSGYKGVFDGKSHTITVAAPEGAVVTFSISEDGEYASVLPMFTGVGTYTVYYKITKDNYVTVTGSEIVVIEAKTIADMEATLEYESVVYDAAAKTPAVTIVGLSENDYEVSYENNTNVGRATITITGVGNYNGKITKVFDITPAGIAGITASDYEGAFDGKAHSITVNAPEGAVVKYSTSLNGVYSTQAPTLTNVGTMTVFYRVERANFVTVVDTATVTITAKSIEDMGAELEYDSVTYDGTAKFPTVTVEGLTVSDYEVSYEGNTNAGTATVTITGKGNFEGKIMKTFEIAKATLDGVLAEGYEGIYDGTAYSITVTAQEDVVVTYATSEDGEYTTEKPMFTEAGKYTVYYKVVRDNYETYISFETVIIMPKTIVGLESEIEYDEVIFNDTAKTPSVKVDGLSENDFEVAYTNNIEIGTATVTITGTGNYTGTITKTFEILDPGVTGDVNGDGIVNTVDASIVISYYYGNVDFDETQMRLADVNGDGVISTVDASMIISYYYGNIDSFA